MQTSIELFFPAQLAASAPVASKRHTVRAPYLAALHQANDATDYGNGTVSGSTGGANGLFGFGLTTGSTYALPEGKSIVIGSIGTSVAAGSGQVGGMLFATGTGTNTAILTGSSKLAGFSAGDINIHANAVGDTQTLNLQARAAGDTLPLGTGGRTSSSPRPMATAGPRAASPS